MLTFLKNQILYLNKYKTHPEAVVIACYFNPQNSPYRQRAFWVFYDTVRHLNHRIVECVIGDATPQLPENAFITRVHTPNLLWHKETLLNKLVAGLPREYKYVFWLDADVIFENKNWLVEGVQQLQTHALIQPFEYCVHLEKDQKKYASPVPLPEVQQQLQRCLEKKIDPGPIRVWRSFAANHQTGLSAHAHYDIHGHVGFAWGARRKVLETVPLYERAFVGGADHIVAHAGAGHLGHACIGKSFTDNLAEVNEWSRRFYEAVQGRVGFVSGNLLHIWHGDVEKRQYLKRIQEFTPHTKQITEKDENGLYVTSDDTYVRNYFSNREVASSEPSVYSDASDYSLNSTDTSSPQENQGRNVTSEAVVFGGGSFGGGGAGGDWGNNTAPVAHSSNDHAPFAAGEVMENASVGNAISETNTSESTHFESSHFS